jgi:hypothetical protein
MTAAKLSGALVAMLALVALTMPQQPAAEPGARVSDVCADYDNQADAQRAKDTIDADGDGIYCEALPCPCLKPGTKKPRPKPKRKKKRPQTLKSKRVYVTDYGRTGNLRFKPRAIYYVMGARIRDITWTSWGGPVAKGTGTIEWKFCDPDCATGERADFSVAVSLRTRRVCRRYRRYKRLRWTFLEEEPQPTNPFEHVFKTQRMVCPK